VKKVQVSRWEMESQVGKGEEMRLCESLMNSEESSDQQGVLTEEDQKYILIIGGIEVFLPHGPVEARACVADATVEEGQPTVTVIEEEEEQTLMFAPTEKEENSDELLTQWEQELDMLEDWLKNPEPVDDCHEETVMQIAGEENSTELLKNFSPGVEQEMTAALEPAAEEEANNIDFVELYEELEFQERRINMQSRHTQQDKLETGGGAYQPGEQLEGVGVEPTQEEMT
jgi:hypothetical protein